MTAESGNIGTRRGVLATTDSDATLEDSDFPFSLRQSYIPIAAESRSPVCFYGFGGEGQLVTARSSRPRQTPVVEEESPLRNMSRSNCATALKSTSVLNFNV
jgi:hypothetical protein